MFPTSTQERRRSWNSLATSESWRPRSASTGVIEISPFSRNLANSQRTPATPCFVSPRMAFSTQFSYDSPIQVLTSSSPCVFQPMSVRGLRKRCSLSRLPHRCKILLIVLLLSFSASLYYIRGLKETSGSTVPCTEESCSDSAHDLPSIQKFLGTVNQSSNLHSLTEDLDNPYIEMHNAPSLQGDSQTISYAYDSHSAQIPNEEPQSETKLNYAYSPNRAAKVSGVYIEDHNPLLDVKVKDSSPVYEDVQEKELVGNQENVLLNDYDSARAHERERRDANSGSPTVQFEESSIASNEPQNLYYPPRYIISEDSNLHPQIAKQNINSDQYLQRPEGRPIHKFVVQGENYIVPQSKPEEYRNVQPQYMQTFSDGRQPQYSERDARMMHNIPSEYISEDSQTQDFDRMPYQDARQMPMGYLHGGAPMGGAPFERNEPVMYDGQQMERHPPGVNPRRYRNEF